MNETSVTIVDLRTNELVLSDSFSDSFLFEVVAMYTDSTDLQMEESYANFPNGYVVNNYLVTFVDLEN